MRLSYKLFAFFSPCVEYIRMRATVFISTPAFYAPAVSLISHVYFSYSSGSTCVMSFRRMHAARTYHTALRVPPKRVTEQAELVHGLWW